MAATSVLAPACSSEDAAPTTGGPIAIEVFHDELEKASCELAVKCGIMPDQAICLDVNSPGRTNLQLLADVVFGMVTYDAAAARACIDALRARGCEALDASAKALDQACDNVFRGTVPEGGGCVVDDECTGDARCDLEMCMGGGACCVGKCAPKPSLVALGGDCAMETCVETAYCDKEDDGMGNVTAECKARVKNGQPCEDEDGCEDGLRCDTAGGKTCFILSKEGQPCNANLENPPCLRVDNWCHATDEKCARLPGAGEPCTDKNECLSYAYCDAGTCKSKPLEGEACTMDGPSCLGSLQCAIEDMMMAGTCKRPSPQEVCVLNSDK